MANVTAAADQEQERQRERTARQESRQSKRHEPGAPMNHRQIMEALTGLLAAFFTAILSSTIVANALPTIMSELKGTQTDFAWVITAALLANAATTPIWGKLADLFDKKVLVQLSIVIFVAGSVMAGFSENIPFLLTARVIQGIAMGGLTALAQAIIGSIIPPRERGKYSGYMGAVMAVGTAGGPLLGGFIVDSSLGWRWTFFVCVPLAVVALILLQVTLKIPHVKRPAKIDWVGSILLTSGVSLLLIWVSFAGKADYYDWWSWQSAVMVGGGVLLLALLVLVESKVPQPIIPLKIISERTTALAIVASVAVGVAMFGSSTFLGQYYQVARGATPTEAGLLTLPMIAGNLIGSVVSGQLISRYGKWKRFLIGGTVLLIGGLALAGTMDHTTELWLTGLYTGIFGIGLGMLMQNLVLAVQNTVRASDIGSASASVAFFRSVGGAIGVSVLGAVMANHVKDLATDGLAKLGIPAGGNSGATLDLKDLPAPIAEVMRAAYGDATAGIFMISAIVAAVALIAVIFIKEVPLRKTVDITPEKALEANAAGEAGMTATMTGQLPMVSSDVPDGTAAESTGARSALRPAAAPAKVYDGGAAAAAAASGRVATEDFEEVFARSFRSEELDLRSADSVDRAADAIASAAATLQKLQDTQDLLARQQAELGTLVLDIQQQLRSQQEVAAGQAATAAELSRLQRKLLKERKIQAAAALYLAGHGKHSAAAPSPSGGEGSAPVTGR
ncbi:MDR family MFS transporter [Pseudarthrobacter niigatensis]|uniref:EmrB/QacA subfamily drug resistance transporter n=1 Tax=Pseudarthrobacter niigatensis TaxID=369935 RepID=A0AAJ1SYC7_9MICC|nr:MDR family MFS transporter [Pseudarthrobacter niigatensis]MDQ0146946.1 EmrB/QacA subfamily drug resistance transporter [Pseudarthrobacter niigatensis]MDQ0267078.1 EmrB/QacA subfamily drug resistance transporter [Pseudarthrobacter niigatensis]